MQIIAACVCVSREGVRRIKLLPCGEVLSLLWQLESERINITATSVEKYDIYYPGKMEKWRNTTVKTTELNIWIRKCEEYVWEEMFKSVNSKWLQIKA